MNIVIAIKSIWAKLFRPKYWYVVYADGQVDGGIIHLETAIYVANERRKAGRGILNIIHTKSIKKYLPNK